jgi:hypothetical protein
MTIAMTSDATTSRIQHNGADVIECTATQTTVNGNLIVDGTSNRVPVIKTALSAAHTAVSGETLTLAHGLGFTPSSCRLIFQCDVADLGYSVGEKVSVTGGWNGSTVFYPTEPFVTSTNCTVQAVAGYVMYLTHKTTGVITTPTATRWRYYFEVYI